jgi:hypothetical protein
MDVGIILRMTERLRKNTHILIFTIFNLYIYTIEL